MVAPARSVGLPLRIFILLALVTAAAAKDRGNPWKHKGARADDYNGKIPKELAANKAYFEERDAARKSMLRGNLKKKSSKKKGAKKSLTKPSKLNHMHHHEHRRRG